MALSLFDPELSGALRAVTGLSVGWLDDARQEAFEGRLRSHGFAGICALGSTGAAVGYGVVVRPGDVRVLVEIGSGEARTLSATETGRIPWLLYTVYLAVSASRWGSAAADWARIRSDVVALAADLGGASDLDAFGALFSDPKVRRLIESGAGLRTPARLLRRLDPSPKYSALVGWFEALRTGGPVTPPAALGAFRPAAALLGFAVALAGDQDPTPAAWLALQTRAGLDQTTQGGLPLQALHWAGAPQASKAQAAAWIAAHPVEPRSPLHSATVAWASAGDAYTGTGHLEAARASGSTDAEGAAELYASAAWFVARTGSQKAVATELAAFAARQGWSDLAAIARGL
jgi:hypothetical protein